MGAQGGGVVFYEQGTPVPVVGARLPRGTARSRRTPASLLAVFGGWV